jgi:hypothetical protein
MVGFRRSCWRRRFEASGLAEYLANAFEIPVEVFDPFRQIEVDANKFDPDYMKEIVAEMAVAVGSRVERSRGMIKINLLESVTDRPQGRRAKSKKRSPAHAFRAYCLR